MRPRSRHLVIGAVALALLIPPAIAIAAGQSGRAGSSQSGPTAVGVPGITTAIPAGTVTRLSGAGRFETAAAISAATFSPGVDVAYIAYAFNFPDALAGAAAAGADPGPLLLVGTLLPLPPATVTELIRLQPKEIVVLGGPGVISEAVKSALAQYAVGGEPSAPYACKSLMAGTYLASYTAQGGAKVARILNLERDGSASMVNRDDGELQYTDSGRDSQSEAFGTWTCAAGVVTLRVLDAFRYDDTVPTHTFDLDRIDITAAYSVEAAGPTLTGDLTYCSWPVPIANPALVRTTTSVQCAAFENGVDFYLNSPFVALRITP